MGACMSSNTMSDAGNIARAATVHGAVAHTDECIAALTAALEAMRPPIDVHDGVLRIIAAFVPYNGAL